MTTFKAQESQNLAQLANIRGKINQLKGLNLVQSSRRFIYEGDVDKVSASSGIINTRHLFLFNDLLIYGSVKHKGTLYEYSDHIYVKHLNLKDISFKSSSKIGFQLVRSDETKQRDYIMLCRSLEDKQTWVQHIQLAIEECKNTLPESLTEAQAHQHGASATTKHKKSSRETSDGIMKAAMVGNLDAISQHIRDGSDISAQDPETGQTMLHKLSHAGHAPLLHLLLEAYTGNATALVNLKDFSGATALHYAANTGQVESQQVLLSYGANAALLDDDQASPLHYASRQGRPDALAHFLAYPIASSLVFKKDSQGLTPASYAAFHGNKEALAALLNHMRSSISSQAKSPTSSPSVRFSSHAPSSSDIPSSIVEPLHFAAMNNHIDCVDVMLAHISELEEAAGEGASQRRSGSGINAQDRQGLAAAHHAALNGHSKLLSMLHTRGADMLARDGTGGTTMHAACTGGSIECVKYLMSACRDKNIITSVDSGGMSPLHRAVVAGHLCIVWELLNTGVCSDELVNLKDNRGQTALHIASENKWGGCALLLINIGKADVTIRDEEGHIPLHVAMKHGAKEIVSYIANSEHEITKREGETLLKLGRQHPDCVKIICQITGLSADIKENAVVERSSSVSSFTSDLSESSNVDSEISSDTDDDESTEDADEDSTSRSEIKQRVAEMWQGVRSDELLSNLFLETIRSLYRLPQDGDFGVTYWTYVNNFVQKVSQNPATDRGLMALRRDLNLDFLENHSRLGRTTSSSMLDLRASGSSDDSERSPDKPLLQRTVATRRMPLGSPAGTRPPMLARSSVLSTSLSSITPNTQLLPDVPRNPSGSTSPSLAASTSAKTSPPSSSVPQASSSSSSSPSALRREASTGQASPVSSRRLLPSVSFGALPSLLSDHASKPSHSSSSEDTSSAKASGTKSSKLDVSRVKADTKQSYNDAGRERSIESSRDKPSEKKAHSAKAEHSLPDKASSRHKKTKPINGDDAQRKPDQDSAASSNSRTKFVTDLLGADALAHPDAGINSRLKDLESALKKSASASKLDSSESAKKPKKEEAHPRNASSTHKKSPHHTGNLEASRATPESEAPQEDSGDVRKNKGTSNPSFWETAISTPTAPSQAEHSRKSSPATIHELSQRVDGGSVPAAVTTKRADDGDVAAAIEGLLIDQEASSQLHRPQLARTVSTYNKRATKKVVFLEKKREEQIASVLHGHDVSPRQLKHAIRDADCSVLIPGLLSALAPILPSKKEATICADHHLPSDLETLPDLSDRELAQLFVVEMASTSRVHQRVEALTCRSGFELKASMLHKMIKTHFTICSQLTTNNRLKDVIEVLLSFAAGVAADPPKREDVVQEVMERLREAIPEFLDIIKPIVGTSAIKDTADISVAWTELQYGVSVCRQEVSKCTETDPLVSLLTNFITEAEPEMEQLQKEIDVWEAITDKVGTNLNDLVPILGLPSGADDEGRPGAGGDPISTLLSVFSLVLKTIKEEEQVEEGQEIMRTGNKKKEDGGRHKSGKHKRRQHHHLDPNSPFSRDKLKGEKILQPELTPLRVTFNAYKDFCAKTSKVKRKTYTFLKQNKPRAPGAGAGAGAGGLEDNLESQQ